MDDNTLLCNQLGQCVCQLWTCVLLTKLHHRCISQLGVIIKCPVGVIIWTSPECSSMYPALHHCAGCECMPPPWLCTFRKGELWRGKTTDWWFKNHSGHTTYSCANLEPSLECRTYTSEIIANCGRTLPLPTSVDLRHIHTTCSRQLTIS